MKNLFDFATKELSQDAFLRWFFENYDDKQIGPIVADFINYFSKGQLDGKQQFNLKKNDITNVVSHAQVNNIDVSIDFWCEKLFEGRRTIVIEDKTGSLEHNQLEDYNKAISKWIYKDSTPDKCVYKIFYKTHNLGKTEKDRVKDSGWTAFGINEIYDFFIQYKKKTHSDVLNDYIEHIEDIYNCSTEVSNELCSEWNSINWETFLNKYMELKHLDIDYRFDTYRGFSDSMVINFKLNNNRYLEYLTLEIQIKDKLIPYLRPGLHIDDKWEWSINAFEENKHFEECKQELEDFRFFIENNSTFIKKINTARAVGKIDEIIPLEFGASELEAKIDKWINELNRLVSMFNKER